eukprot:364798-Chlamydomonas_euryale.AAC.8
MAWQRPASPRRLPLPPPPPPPPPLGVTALHSTAWAGRDGGAPRAARLCGCGPRSCCACWRSQLAGRSCRLHFSNGSFDKAPGPSPAQQRVTRGARIGGVRLLHTSVPCSRGLPHGRMPRRGRRTGRMVRDFQAAPRSRAGQTTFQRGRKARTHASKKPRPQPTSRSVLAPYRAIWGAGGDRACRPRDSATGVSPVPNSRASSASESEKVWISLTTVEVAARARLPCNIRRTRMRSRAQEPPPSNPPSNPSNPARMSRSTDILDSRPNS